MRPLFGVLVMILSLVVVVVVRPSHLPLRL